MLEYKVFRPHQMSDKEMEELADLVREPFNWYAPGSENDDIFDLLRGKGASVVDVVFDDGGPIGFLASETGYHLGHFYCYHIGVSLLAEAQGKQIYPTLTQRSLARGDYDFLIAQTRNQNIYASLRRYAVEGKIWPSPEVVPPEQIYELAQLACKHPLERATLAVRGIYTYVREERSFMTSRRDDVRTFFEQSLGYYDGFMVVVGIK